MSTVLYLNASLGGDASHSKRLAGDFLTEWRQRHPEDAVVERDLAASPPPLINEAFVGARRKAAGDYTPEEAVIMGVSDAYLDEFLGADYVVMAAPVYNFTLPTPLKAYIDLILRSGRTLPPLSDEAAAVLQAKKVLVVSARMGDYGPGTGREHFDYHEPYLRFLFSRLGITDVTYVAASQNPMHHDEATRATQMAGYVEQVREVVARWSAGR